MDKSKYLVSIAGAVLVPAFEFLYGSGDVVYYGMLALLFFIGMDWISGVRAAKKDDTYASEYGIDGVFRSFFMLLLPAGGHFVDQLFTLPGVVFGLFAGGLLFHVLKSMTANAIRAGWGNRLPISALNFVINFVGSELDNKIKRAESRKGESL
ncbi:phage holin family protein [Paenibacillus sp. FSL K6-2524]|uniref:phage holin family protein n=1 Tax=Paenibacillus sp. FSL K6-2524 TaxID=2954516 RepID=UPI0030FB059F